MKIRSLLTLFVSSLALTAIVAGCSGGGDDDDDDDDGGGGLEVTSIAPTTGPVGTEVVVTGSGFGDQQGDSTVSVGGTDATVVSWAAGSITVEVPDVMPGSRQLTVTVEGESSAPQAFQVVLPPRVYVNDGVVTAANSTVSAFDLAADGTLTEIAGSPFATNAANGFDFGGGPGSMAIDEANRRLFVTGSSAIAVFSIDGATGALTHAPGSPYRTGDEFTFGVAVHPNGNHLYASLCDTGLMHFVVASNGMLTPGPGPDGPAYGVAGCPDAVFVTPDGGWVLVRSNDVFYAFEVEANGALVDEGGTNFFALPDSSYGSALTNDGTRIYNAHYTPMDVSALDFNLTTGGATELANSTYDVADQANTITLSPDESLAYVSTWGTSGVVVMDVEADGDLVYQSKAFTETDLPGPMAVSPDGSLLVVTTQGPEGSVEVFTIAGDGSLTHADTVALPTDSTPAAVVVTGP